MGKSLVIVESHEKAITISNLLGPDFVVKASLDVFMNGPNTILTRAADNSLKLERAPAPVSEELRRIVSGAEFDSTLLAPDSNPIGEALALCWNDSLTTGLPNAKRIRFNEITWPALAAAIDTPVAINEHWINAQMTRQALEQLFQGYFQPIIWKNTAIPEIPNLYQCLILRLLCEREAEQANFIPQEIWRIKADFKTEKSPAFRMDLQQMAIHENLIPTQAHAIAVQDILKSQSYTVKDSVVTMRSQAPAPPFTTETLVQDAFERLGFGARQTLEIARQLYSGVSLGRAGWIGLIDFWLTQSIRIPGEVMDSTREFIWINYGSDYLPAQPRSFKDKSRTAPGTESIRPTDIKRLPKSIKKYLSHEQYQLYDLVWRRFIASQMADAQIEDCSAAVGAGAPERFLFAHISSELKFRGYLQVYENSVNAMSDKKSKNAARIPPGLTIGEKCELKNLHLDQQPSLAPEPYAESELAAFLLNHGLVRPGDLNTIFEFLIDKEFAESVNHRLKPLESGRILNQFLLMNFPMLLDVKFLGRVQKTLNLVEKGDLSYQEALSAFQESLKRALKSHERPKGDTKNGLKSGADAPMICEQCGSGMIVKNGRHGRFWACKNYPRCKATRPFAIGVSCPMSDCDGQIIERKSAKGAIFFGCSNYPVCKFASWHPMVSLACKHCGNGYLEERFNEYQESFLYCVKCKKHFSSEILKIGEDGAL